MWQLRKRPLRSRQKAHIEFEGGKIRLLSIVDNHLWWQLHRCLWKGGCIEDLIHTEVPFSSKGHAHRVIIKRKLNVAPRNTERCSQEYRTLLPGIPDVAPRNTKHCSQQYRKLLPGLLNVAHTSLFEKIAREITETTKWGQEFLRK